MAYHVLAVEATYGANQTTRMCFVVTVTVLPLPASAWNIPGHMLSGAIAYQVLQQESPQTFDKVKAVLEKHPWYANQWHARLQDVPVADHGLVLFMQATRWADDIRTRDKAQNRPPWHYINFPFKPEGQPANVKIRESDPVNILTALAENESVLKNGSHAERKAVALAWLFHLVGDVHQPLHTAQLFTVEYPHGDRGGNEICVRVTQARQPMDLHRFWDGVITSSQNLTRLRNEATVLRNRQEFQRSQLTELASSGFESWAKESYEIATKIAYRNGGRIGSPRGGNMDCAMMATAPVLPVGYVVSVSRIADRRMILAGYRLADLLMRLVRNQAASTPVGFTLGPYFILDGTSQAIDNMTMLDKELGKLWADTNYMETGYSGLVACLIRKLVDERKNLLLMRHAGGARWTDKEEAAAEKLALCDFGIDPKTWE